MWLQEVLVILTLSRLGGSGCEEGLGVGVDSLLRRVVIPIRAELPALARFLASH